MVWDSETKLWHTITGSPLRLVLESDSFDVLVERVRLAAPEMLELNRNYKGPIKLIFEIERVDDLNVDVEMVS
jgi:hypothetical protein